ncbi:hypothetical protein KO500_14770 [Cellulophaga baltica]|uniref:hypothetical protein n=1 Tax=Cellulophaga TaxID=104264 RepID=UPI001C073EC4|nr:MULTISPECIES: hypothetical protein [Cellulophaga]MBU2997710.1 hypothetical protein [Cellulophaga baltica]MDO6769105.1 hypothetical protein [Cellulophaga sp. 1_MG-2023]
MKSNFHYKKIISAFILIIGLGIISYATAHFFIKQKIEALLSSKTPENINVTYDDLKISLLNNKFELSGIQIDSLQKDNPKSKVLVNRLEISGLNYYSLVKSDKVILQNVYIDSLQTVYYKVDKKDTTIDKESQFKKEINIQNFKINNSGIKVFNTVNDSIEFSAQKVSFQFSDIIVNKKTLAQKIPFLYKSFKGSTGVIVASLGDFEALRIESIKHDINTVIKNFSLKSKYDKVKLQSKLYKERDYINLKIPEIKLNDVAVKTTDSKASLLIASSIFDKLNLEIYRNKLLPDDTTIKPMFSSVFKKLPFILRIPVMKVKNGTIKYSELVNKGTYPGELLFTDVNSTIRNSFDVDNLKIEFNNTANLMGVAPIKLDWTFYTENDKKMFKANGVIKNFDAKYINDYLKSNLQAKATGVINELYFTIGGNDYASNGDIKMKYEDFKFLALKKNGLGVDKFLTFIGKIFINDGSKTDTNGYRYGQIEVERDPTKSFFNYLWLNVKSGIISTMIGNGKKD